MKSQGDPILDAQTVCQYCPVTLEQLTVHLKAFGWHPELIPEAIDMATGIYIEKGDDGLYRPRAGNVGEILEKVFKP